MQKNLFILLLLITSLNANEYNFDLMDDKSMSFKTPVN